VQILYYDGQFDDARLNVALATTAAAAGAAVANYVEATNLIRVGAGGRESCVACLLCCTPPVLHALHRDGVGAWYEYSLEWGRVGGCVLEGLRFHSGCFRLMTALALVVALKGSVMELECKAVCETACAVGPGVSAGQCRAGDWCAVPGPHQWQEV
jgi:hypothetical protein